MNLTGKYIEINKNNAKTIITILYNNKYRWTMDKFFGDAQHLEGLIYTLSNYESFINYDGEKSYILYHSKYKFYFYKDIPYNFELFDINKY